MKILLPLIIATLLSSCIYSKKPFFPEDKAIEQKNITGNYKSGSEQFTIALLEKNNYGIKVKTESGSELYNGWLTKINNSYYANLMVVEHAELPQLSHLLIKVNFIDNDIEIEYLNVDYLTEAKLKEQFGLTILYSDGDYTELGSGTDELYRFLQKIDKDPKAFNEKKLLTRIN